MTAGSALFEQTHTATPVAFTVVGVAQTAGSKRAFRHPHTGALIVTDDNPRSKSWQAAVAEQAADAMHGQPLLQAPLAVSFTFYRPRPKNHYRTGRNADRVRATAPAWPTTRPDVLKVARATEDAMTGIVWRDDAQIVDEHLVKVWGEPARLEVSIRPLPVREEGSMPRAP